MVDQNAVFLRWKDELKNYLVSCKLGLDYRAIQHHLVEQMGKAVPLSDMGFNRWEDFVYECRDIMEVGVPRFAPPSGNTKKFLFLRIDAVDAKTAHLYKLVQGQEKGKSRKAVDGTVKEPSRNQVTFVDPRILLTGKSTVATYNPGSAPTKPPQRYGASGKSYGNYSRPTARYGSNKPPPRFASQMGSYGGPSGSQDFRSSTRSTSTSIKSKSSYSSSTINSNSRPMKFIPSGLDCDDDDFVGDDDDIFDYSSGGANYSAKKTVDEDEWTKPVVTSNVKREETEKEKNPFFTSRAVNSSSKENNGAVSVSAPLVSASVPLFSASVPSVSASVPSVSASVPSVSASVPSASAPISAPVPLVSVPTPSVSLNKENFEVADKRLTTDRFYTAPHKRLIDSQSVENEFLSDYPKLSETNGMVRRDRGRPQLESGAYKMIIKGLGRSGIQPMQQRNHNSNFVGSDTTDHNSVWTNQTNNTSVFDRLGPRPNTAVDSVDQGVYKVKRLEFDNLPVLRPNYTSTFLGPEKTTPEIVHPPAYTMGPCPKIVPVSGQLWHVVVIRESRWAENSYLILRRADDNIKINPMEDAMAKFYDSDVGKAYMVKENPTKGFYAVFWYKANKWIRGQLFEAPKEATSIVSFFAIDHGIFVKVDKASGNLRHLKKDFTKVPSSAYFGKLLDSNGAEQEDVETMRRNEGGIICRCIRSESGPVDQTIILYGKLVDFD